MNRYHRQMLLSGIGTDGQARIARARVLLIGCGALGCTIADLLVRGGVGHLRIVDRDIVELTNLQRQTLFDETDAREGLPKSVAATQRLRRVNSEIEIEPMVADVNSSNIEMKMGLGNGRVDLILDGTDNVETRFLINDAAVKHGVPWVYGACVQMDGRVMLVEPGKSACMRCVFPNPPAASELPTCDTAGVLGPAASIIASMQAGMAIQYLAGGAVKMSQRMMVMDVAGWNFRSIEVGGSREDCECCGKKNFEFLNRRVERSAVSLCGRNSVQVHSASAGEVKLPELAVKLGPVGRVQSSPYLLRCQLNEEAGIQLSVFPDGRTIVQGTTDFARARSLVSRYVGL